MFGLKKKKYLEYYFDDIELDNAHEDIIDEFICPSTTRSSSWWSSLNSTVDLLGNHYNYIRGVQIEHASNGPYTNGPELLPTRATAKGCPAINNLLNNSFLVKSPTNIIITVSNDGGYVYNAPSETITIGTHSPKQFRTSKNDLFEGKLNLKFALGLNIRTDNIPWIFVQPAYHNNAWFSVAPATIERNYTKGQQVNINVFVDIPKGEPVTYEIKAGDVLAYMWLPEETTLKHTKSKFLTPLFKRNWSAASRFS